MIPAWSFFAPNPGTTDLHLLYRDRLVDDSVTCWKEVVPRSTWLRFCWNPTKRLQKGISDMADVLQRFALSHRDHGELILIHPTFLALLHFVSRQPHSPIAMSTQFILARSQGVDTPEEAEIMFLSSFHRI
jgi:hypothetical protein